MVKIYLEDENKTLKLVYDYYSNKLGRKTVSTNFLKTNNTITIQGWCPVEDNEKLKEICNEQLKDDYYITFEDVKSAVGVLHHDFLDAFFFGRLQRIEFFHPQFVTFPVPFDGQHTPFPGLEVHVVGG